jgi:hypothetical protein
MYHIKSKASTLKTMKDMVMHYQVRAIVGCEAWWDGDCKVKTNKTRMKSCSWPLHPPETSYMVIWD